MFTLLYCTAFGWSEYLGIGSDTFPTEEAATEAAKELDRIWDTSKLWIIYPTDKLHELSR